MSCNLPELRELLETEGLRYYLIPDQEGVMLTVKGTEAKYQFKILLELDNEFLQFRSIDYLHCPMDHPNLGPTLQVLGEINYRLRLLKFGWDPTDGEIAVYADLWMVDSVITQEQFSRMVNVYMSIIDDEYVRLVAAIGSGIGPDQGRGGDPSDDDEIVDSL
jgi:hypothetical protein